MTGLAEISKTGTGDTNPTQPKQELMEAEEEISEPPMENFSFDLAPLQVLKEGGVVSKKKTNFSRLQVVENVQNAFDLIGGTPRLAIWADENPNDFYRMYAKLLPSTNSSALGESNKLEITLKVPRGPLDE